jgi:hypothetical protein
MRRQLGAPRASVSLDAESSLAADLCLAIEEGSVFDSIAARIRQLGRDVDPIGAAGLYGREVLGFTYREIAAMIGVSPRTLAEASRRVAMRIL